MSKRPVLLIFAILTVSSLIAAESAVLSKTANCSTFPNVYPPNASSNIENFEYVLSNYTVTYAIKAMPPPDRLSDHPYAYNIVVHGPPPFPIQIEFYQQNWDNITEKSTHIMQTNAYSISIGCISYPTQITMMRVDNASASPTPTSTPSSTTTPTPVPTPTDFTTVIGVTVVAVVIGAGLGLLIYLIKRK